MKRVRNLSTELFSWVQAQAGNQVLPGIGDIFFQVPTGSSTAQFITWLQSNGVEKGHYFTDINSAYAAMKDGRNDVLIVLPGNHTTTTALPWTKSYAHVIGTYAGAMNQRSRISTSTVGISPLVAISGTSLYKNILFSQEGSHATGNAYCVQVTAGRSIFDTCGIRNIGALAVVDSSHRSLVIGTTDDITFRNCQIGETSYNAVTASSSVIEFTGTQGGKYLFYDCLILGASSANATFLKIPANAGGFWLFKDTVFHNQGTAMTQAFSISATGNDKVLLKHCMVDGATNLETSDSNILKGINAQAAATGELSVTLTG